MPATWVQRGQRGIGSQSSRGKTKRTGKRESPMEQANVDHMLCSWMAFLVCVSFCDAIRRTNRTDHRVGAMISPLPKRTGLQPWCIQWFCRVSPTHLPAEVRSTAIRRTTSVDLLYCHLRVHNREREAKETKTLSSRSADH
jgi:hypothetical protein